MEEFLLILPRGEKVVVQEISEEQKVGSIIIAVGKVKDETKLKAYRVVAIPVVTTDRLRDLVVGDKVLALSEDVKWFEQAGKRYGIIDEDFLFGHVNG